jgi:putative transcriptional regulator
MRTVTLAEADELIAKFDWSKIEALSDDDILEAIAGDPDTADVSKVPAENWQRLYSLPDIKALRDKLGMSQKDFALAFRISKRTLENWEQGRRRLDGVVSVYLALIAAFPNEIAALVKRLDRPNAEQRSAAE